MLVVGRLMEMLSRIQNEITALCVSVSILLVPRALLSKGVSAGLEEFGVGS